MPSFDVVSVVNMQEVDNAVNQAIKEIGQRYDFKGTKTEITKDKDGIKVLTDDDYRLKAVVDVLQSKCVKRGVSLKALQYGKVEPASGGLVRQVISIQQGISTEKGTGDRRHHQADEAEGPVPDPGRAGPGDREEHRRPPGGHPVAEGEGPRRGDAVRQSSPVETCALRKSDRGGMPMANDPFYRELRGKTDPLWEAMFQHPFVKGIGDGTLSRDRFEFYLKQDYVYLIDFSRVFALACAKSRTLPEMGTFAALLHATLNTEMELHRKTCAAFGIAEQELARTRKSPITSAYTDLLVRTAYEGGIVRHIGGIAAVRLRVRRDREEAQVGRASGRPVLPGLDRHLLLPGVSGIRRRTHRQDERTCRRRSRGTQGAVASAVRIERPLRIPVLRHELENGVARKGTLGKLRKNVGEIGEFPLIDRIRKILPASRNKDLLVDIGDDTAVVRLDERRALLLTCDIQVEGQHFRLDRTTPYRVGRRAMAVNLSDIASMGGTPTYALVSLGLPADFPVKSYDRLFEGMRDELLPHRACIIGGNLARTKECLIVDVTLLGEADPSRVLTRGGARAGDRIFVTGHLGASGAGFQALKAFGKKVPGKYREMVSRHVLPVPRVDLGRRISRSGVASAMIDVSDGVAADLHHVCTRSGVGAEIHEDQLPLPERIGEIARRSGTSVLELACTAERITNCSSPFPPGYRRGGSDPSPEVRGFRSRKSGGS